MRLTSHDSQHTAGWYLRGRLAEQQHHLDQAIEAYHHVLQTDPDHEEAHYNLGFLYQQQNQPQKAISHFHRVTELNPSDAEAYFNLGVNFSFTKPVRPRRGSLSERPRITA